MIAIKFLLLILAFISAILAAGKLNLGAREDGKPRFNPDWVGMALAFWFASLLVRG